MRRVIISLGFLITISACSSGLKAVKDYTVPNDDFESYTFTVYAPDANKVFLAGEMTEWDPKAVLMDKDVDGYWRKTLYLDDGKWQYKFVVDGVWIHDQENPNRIADGYGGYNSYILIGDIDDDSEYNSDIPHGLLTNITIMSEAYGEKASFNLYLPPDYDSTNRDYPLLYLLHGMGEDEHQWAEQGLIQNYMDNYIDAGSIRPFIVVMPAGGTSFYTNDVETFIVEELYAYLTNTFRIRAGKPNTAISGMSMGGFGAFYLAQRNPESFGLSVPLSGYFDKRRYLKDFDDVELTVDFELVIYCGTLDTLCYGSNQDLVEYLDRWEQPYEFITSAGGHTWWYWNRITPEVLRLISEFFYGGG